MNDENPPIEPTDITCIIFDFGFTLSSDLYFKVAPPECPTWQELIQKNIFKNNHLVDSWMAGKITIHHIAEELAPIVKMDVTRIIEFLELGCQKLDFNEAVLNFAIK